MLHTTGCGRLMLALTFVSMGCCPLLLALVRFRVELAQLTSLRSLAINLRGAFTQEEAAALTPLVRLSR